MLSRIFRRREPTLAQQLFVCPTERVYAVGDIHGRHDLVELLFEKIVRDMRLHDDGRKTKIVFLGDYVDRGDHSMEVVDLLIEIKGRVSETVTFLMGNHEKALLDFLNDPMRGRHWLEFGGRQTLASYGVSPPQQSDQIGLHRARDELAVATKHHLDFFESLIRIYRSGDVVFAHAGFDPGLDDDSQIDDVILWGDGDCKPTLGGAGTRVVHGHFDNPNPISLPERICVDTGAFYTGTLTAVRLDSGETFLST